MSIITIIGAGNGAHALAADCKLGGAQVRMYEFTKFHNKVRGILKSRRIRLEGIEMNAENFKRNGTVSIDMVTYDMKEAVHGADHILISVQAQGFEEVFGELAPLLEDGQTVSIFPDNFGSLILRRIMREKNIHTKVIIAGFSSLVYGARLTDYNNMETETDVVNITYRENDIRVDTLPSGDYDLYLAKSREIPAFDATKLIHGDTVLDIGLSNLNPLAHIPCVILNIGAIENWGVVPYVGAKDVYYDIYAYGDSPGVARVQYAYYKDLLAIAKAYGIHICHVDENALQSRMCLIGEIFYGKGFRLPFTEALDQTVWLPVPQNERFTLNSRYMTEDIPVGCCSAISFAKVLDVKTPTLCAVTNLANVVMETDYYDTGCNLKAYGVEKLSAEGILKYLRTGNIE